MINAAPTQLEYPEEIQAKMNQVFKLINKPVA